MGNSDGAAAHCRLGQLYGGRLIALIRIVKSSSRAAASAIRDVTARLGLCRPATLARPPGGRATMPCRHWRRDAGARRWRVTASYGY